MPKPATKLKAFVEMNDGAISLTQSGPYTIQFMPNGFVKVLYEGSAEVIKSYTGFDAASLSGPDVTFLNLSASRPLNIVNIAINEAGPGGGLEPSVNIDKLLTNPALLGPKASWADNLDAALDKITVNGDPLQTIASVWDLLDDNYAYYDTVVNEAFVRLGLRYAEYLDEHGGENSLIELIAKFAADGGDAGLSPDRLQTLHDNLLGNFLPSAINDRFGADPALRDEMLTLTEDFASRGWFSGQENHLGGAAHDGVRAFDWDRWGEDSRADWLDTTFNGVVDIRAQASPAEMLYGDGNPVDDWTIVRHEGAGVEVALKVKHRGGDEYAEASTSAGNDGVSAVYQVATGTAAGSATRAEWNFDYAFTELAAGADESLSYEVLVDLDPTSAVAQVALPLTNEYGAPYGDQNSFNYGFIASQIDIDPDTAGVQAYQFGDADFVITVRAYAGDVMVAEINANVLVGDGLV